MKILTCPSSTKALFVPLPEEVGARNSFICYTYTFPPSLTSNFHLFSQKGRAKWRTTLQQIGGNRRPSTRNEAYPKGTNRLFRVNKLPASERGGPHLTRMFPLLLIESTGQSKTLAMLRNLARAYLSRRYVNSLFI